MMTCDDFRDRAFDYLDGSLADPAAFRAHLAACPRCAEALAGISHNEKVLAAARVPAAPADLWPLIAAAISEGRPVARLRPLVATLLAAAAALLVALTLFATAGPSPRPRLDVVIVEADAEAQRGIRGLLPRYQDVDTATAFVDTFFRSDF